MAACPAAVAIAAESTFQVNRCAAGTVVRETVVDLDVVAGVRDTVVTGVGVEVAAEETDKDVSGDVCAVELARLDTLSEPEGTAVDELAVQAESTSATTTIAPNSL